MLLVSAVRTSLVGFNTRSDGTTGNGLQHVLDDFLHHLIVYNKQIGRLDLLSLECLTGFMKEHQRLIFLRTRNLLFLGTLQSVGGLVGPSFTCQLEIIAGIDA